MKLPLAKAALCALALGTCSCADDFGKSAGSANTTVEAEICDAIGPDSRTAIDPTGYLSNSVGILWTPTDSIGVFGNRSTANTLFTNDERSANRKNTTFSGNLAANETAAYAYYPYAAKAGSDATALRGNLPGVQRFSMSTGELKGDYKYGTALSGTSANVRFAFRHVFSLMQVTIDASGTELADEALESIRLSIPGRQLHGDFTFSAVSGDYSFITSDSSLDTIEMQWTDEPRLGEGSQFTGYITVAPTAQPGDRIIMTVTTEGHEAVFEMKALAALAPDRVYSLPLQLALKKDSWTVTKRERPEITSLSFTAAANPGKILDRETVWNTSSKKPESNTTDGVVSLERQSGDILYAYVPYLHSRTLVPTFEVPEGMAVYSGSTKLVSGETPVDFLADDKLRVVAADGAERTYTVKLENTGLPVVVINQSASGDFSDEKEGGNIFGWGATVVNTFIDFKVRGKNTDWVEDDVISVYNADGTRDVSEAFAGIRLRGNSTKKMDKKALAIKFKSKQSVLGMPAHKRWCLLANRIDRSLIRNNVAFKVAHITEGANEEGLEWNPSGRNVELVIDGRYVGNYYLCEQIKIDSERVNINKEYDPEKPKSFEECGYLLELDTQYDENCKFETTLRKNPVMFKDDVPDDFITRIKTMFNNVESLLTDGRYSEAYELLDINSIIDQMLIFEVTMNDEYKHPKSVYYTVNPAGGKTPGDGKIHGAAVWDFDWAAFPDISQRKALGDSKWDETSYTAWNYSKDGQAGDGGRTLTYIWTPLLVKDTAFRERLQERWSKLYPLLKAEIPTYIRLQGSLNARSFAVNDRMWPAGTESSVGDHRNGDEGYATYDQVIESIVSAFETRIEWLNTSIVNGNF